MSTQTLPPIKTKPVGYSPKRHQLCRGGYTAPRFNGADAYGCFSNTGAFLGETQLYTDAIAIVERGAK